MNTHVALNYRRPFSFAVAFHLVVLLLFFFRLNFADTAHASLSTGVVQATLVTEIPVAQPVNTPVSVQQPSVEQKPLVKEKPTFVPPQELLPQEKAPRIESQQKKAQGLGKKRQKEIEQLLHQDLVASSSAKPSTSSAKVATKAGASSSNMDNKEIDHYKSLIISAISHRWIVPENLKKGLECHLKVRLAPGGVVMSVKLMRPSGDAVLDHSAESAICKASPLPVPKNAALFNEFREFNLTVRPEGILAD